MTKRLRIGLLLLAIGLVMWLLFFNRSKEPTQTTIDQASGEHMSEVTRVDISTVQAFHESDTGLWILTSEPAPRLVHYAPATLEMVDSWEQPALVIVDKMAWSPSGNFMIAWARAGVFEPQKVWFVDLEQRTTKELSRRIESVAWTPSEQEIYYVFRPPSGRTTTQLVRADNQFNNWTVLLDPLPIAQPEIAMNTTGNGLLVWEDLHREEFDELDDNVLKIISLDTLAIRTISPPGIYTGAVARSDDVAVASLAYGATNQLIPKLHFIAQDSSTSASTDLVSFPGKFTWLPDQRLLVAAAMNEATLTPNKLESTSDRLMILESGRKPRVVSGYGNLQPVTALALSSDQQSVYLLQSGNLYRIPISLIR